MSHESHELELHIDNTRHLYEQKVRIFKNLAKKKAKGAYDAAKGVKGLLYVADAGAKDYAREHASAGDWSRIFSPSARREVAASFEREFHDWYATDWKYTPEGQKIAARATKPARKPARKRAVKPSAGHCSICKGPHRYKHGRA